MQYSVQTQEDQGTPNELTTQKIKPKTIKCEAASNVALNMVAACLQCTL